MPPKRKQKKKTTKAVDPESSDMDVDERGWISRNVVPILGVVGTVGATAFTLQQLHEHGVLDVTQIVNAVNMLSPAAAQNLQWWGRAVRDAVTGQLVTQVNQQFQAVNEQNQYLLQYMGYLQQALQDAIYANDMARQQQLQNILKRVQMAQANNASVTDVDRLLGEAKVMLDVNHRGEDLLGEPSSKRFRPF